MYYVYMIFIQFYILQLSSNDIEKIEEAKLRAKFPNAAGRPFGGHSVFLQKRLAKGVNILSLSYKIVIL